MTLNLLLAGFDVFSGRLSPGGFILVKTFFEQLRELLDWQGWQMRLYTQTTVDVEYLYKMLNTKEKVKEGR